MGIPVMNIQRSNDGVSKRPRRDNPEKGKPVDDVLLALRRIIHAFDLHSKRVCKLSGLTPPQILILKAIRDLGEVTSGRVSEQVSLSQATVTTIIDRLEQRGLIERYRSLRDRRIVHTKLTADGRKALRKSPPLLHENFNQTFSALDSSRQQTIISTLEDVAEMLGGHELDPAQVLDVVPFSSSGE